MARRAATRNRLISEGVTEATADARIAAWADQATRDGVERGRANWGGRVVLDRRPADAARAALVSRLARLYGPLHAGLRAHDLRGTRATGYPANHMRSSMGAVAVVSDATRLD